MGEGGTPLVESENIGRRLGIRLFFKLEMCNPTGSYKDRFISAQVSQLLQRDVRACLATSSGNTGASLAAYCARYGIACAIFVNEFAPAGKLQQMQAHGARIFRVRDFVTVPEVTERVYQRLQRISEESGMPIIVSAYRYCPDGMRGVQAIAGEIDAQCEHGIDDVFVPVGGGGLFTAICRGFADVKSKRPRVHAVQPEGCATIVSAYREQREKILPVTSTTRVSGLSVPFDIDASIALSELRRCGGAGIPVSDDEVFAAQKMMLREEGIWAEPAGAAALAGYLRVRREGLIDAVGTIVCLVTGHGFKDPESLSEVAHGNTVALIGETELESSLLEAKV
jgi:threonine synthase